MSELFSRILSKQTNGQLLLNSNAVVTHRCMLNRLTRCVKSHIAGCKAIGIDCSSFFFDHADLGSTNIVVEDEPNSGKIEIIDFEISSYFPRS
jgi:hypothetical protein